MTIGSPSEGGREANRPFIVPIVTAFVLTCYGEAGRRTKRREEPGADALSATPYLEAGPIRPVRNNM